MDKPIEITLFDEAPSGYIRTKQFPVGRPTYEGETPTHSDYEHYSRKPAIPGNHSDRAWMISSVFDVAAVYCSCGEWWGMGSIYMQSSPDVQTALMEAHETHKASSST